MKKKIFNLSLWIVLGAVLLTLIIFELTNTVDIVNRLNYIKNDNLLYGDNFDYSYIHSELTTSIIKLSLGIVSLIISFVLAYFYYHNKITQLKKDD